MSAMHPFHLAFPVTSLAKARAFYGDLLGCPEGRSSDAWIDFDLYGHQIVAHLAPDEAGHRRTSAVDGDDVPVRHFGVVLSMDEWNVLAARLRDEGVKFIIEPTCVSRVKWVNRRRCSFSIRAAMRWNSSHSPIRRGYSPSDKNIGSLVMRNAPASSASPARRCSFPTRAAMRSGDLPLAHVRISHACLDVRDR